MRKRFDQTGFTPPAGLGNERRSAALAELIATVVLALSTLVVVTVMSAGIAHAAVVEGVVDHEGSLFGIALMLGMIFIGVGGLLPRGK